METKQKSFFSSLGALGIILGASLIVSVLIGAFTFMRVRSFDNSLSVTGSATMNVVSDQAKWTVGISRQIKVSELKSGYDQMAADLTAVKAFFTDHKVDLSTLTISPISMDDFYDYSAKDTTNQEKQYVLRQRIELSSSDVNAVTTLAQDSSSLSSQGIIFQTQSLEYYYSKLPDLRVSLLSDAIKDAKARASKIAEAGGGTVGTLKSAASGVVQVLPQNSIDVSDYGTYDTSSINKKVMVTVRAAFNIQ